MPVERAGKVASALVDAYPVLRIKDRNEGSCFGGGGLFLCRNARVTRTPAPGLVQLKEAQLGKRTVRKASRSDGRIHALFTDDTRQPAQGRDGWEKRYVKNIRPKSAGQEALIDALDREGVTLALGPAGTGKTFLAVAKAVEALENGRVERIVLCRPAVDAGETLGFLPGDVEAKLAPYLRPIYDVLGERLGAKRLKVLLAEDVIEIAPVAFMRGRTLNNAFVVIDEAQNCTFAQLKMLLTRLGWRTTMVLAGDPDQSDLLPGMSGFSDVAERLSRIDNISVVSLGEKDIIRHPLVAGMLSVL